MKTEEFFIITKLEETSPGELSAKVELNPDHEIFLGHFPGNPVVPGVMTIQIINEVLAKHIEKQILLTEGNNIKFTSMIQPENTPEMDVIIKFNVEVGGYYNVKAEIYSENEVFFKFSGSFK